MLKARFPRVGAIVEGPPLILLKDVQWQTDVMHRMRLDDKNVMAAAHTKSVKTLEQVKYAVLERNGGMSIIKALAESSNEDI